MSMAPGILQRGVGGWTRGGFWMGLVATAVSGRVSMSGGVATTPARFRGTGQGFVAAASKTCPQGPSSFRSGLELTNDK